MSAADVVLNRELWIEVHVNPRGMRAQDLAAIDRVCPITQNGSRRDFTFHAIEIRHARDILNPRRGKLWMMLQIAEALHVQLGPDDELGFAKMDPEEKGEMSKVYGEAVAALFMVQAFNLQWQSINPIPLRGKKAPDYRAQGPGGKYVYEAKGSTSEATHRRHLSKGQLQKQRFASKSVPGFVLASLFAAPDNGCVSTLEIVDPDPPYDPELAFTEEARNRHELEHLRRVVQFAFGTPRIPKRARTFGWGRTRVDSMEFAGKKFVGELYNFGVEAKQLERVIPNELAGITMFRGMAQELVNRIPDAWEDLTKSPYTDVEPLNTLAVSEFASTSVFGDGSILHYQLDNHGRRD